VTTNSKPVSTLCAIEHAASLHFEIVTDSVAGTNYLAAEEHGPPIPGFSEDISGFSKARKRLKIMVVDDEPVIANTLVDILKGEGCIAVAVFSGQAAIEEARLFQPDVVISDVVMPRMTGIQAAEEISEFLPSCRIILFSGQASTKDLLDQARRASGREFELISKPVSPRVLLSVLGLSSSQ
jgi:CheY-like chemotaxis protein